jgi:hypothetical protein
MSTRKRRKIDPKENNETGYSTLLPVIAGEIDLEIGLRQRLAKTLQSRIAWAGTLQKSLGKHKGMLVRFLARWFAQPTPAR